MFIAPNLKAPDAIILLRSSTIDLLLYPIYKYLNKLLAVAVSYVFKGKRASDVGSFDSINAFKNTRELCKCLRRDYLRL